MTSTKAFIPLLLVVFGVSSTLTASLGDTYERNDNVIVLEVASIHSDGEHREDRTFPQGQDSEPFEIVVPVARNFSSLDELYHILREGDSKEPKQSTKAPQTYVKGTEQNSSEYLLFYSDNGGSK